MITRRAFFKNAAGLLVAAPFICKAEWLMPVRAVRGVNSLFYGGNIVIDNIAYVIIDYDETTKVATIIEA
jgi:hypothetical protein